MPATQVPPHCKKARKSRPTAGRPVIDVLRELAFVMHCTRVVAQLPTRAGG
jgi:hypothetical protein